MNLLHAFGKRLVRRLRTPAPRPLPALPRNRSKFRIGVIGFGAIGRLHVIQLDGHPYFELIGVHARSQESQRDASVDGHAVFERVETLLACPLDILLIATPHRTHAGLAKSALEAGIHVICEKPMSVTTADADAMIAAAESGGAVLTVMSQNRFEPSYRKVKAILDSGELGPIRRCSITETFWRPDAYYQKDGWRGTWAGEGGGVLVNQAPHVLDRYVWLCGRPDEISAHCDTLLHEIEVEDSATLLCRHASGIQGHIHLSTNECPPICRMEIACDRGRVTVDQGAITIDRLSESIAQQTASADSGSSIASTRESLGGHLLNWSPELLHAFYEDFAEAIWNGRLPEVTAQQGRDVIEMINAAHLSSASRQTIAVPVNRADYLQFQEQMFGKVSLT